MTSPGQFAWSSRVLHWLMAAAVLTMLLVGGAMVTSLVDYQKLVAIHRPLGIIIFVLVIIRFLNRQLKPVPPFPATMSPLERLVATTSERLMYVLMFALPLVGWGMLSAARYPIVLYGPIHLPPILPQSAGLYTVLRSTHTLLAYLLFFMFMAHLSAVLFHTLVLRDGLLRRMAPWRARPRAARVSTPHPVGAHHVP
jgi:cytochrome b561